VLGEVIRDLGQEVVDQLIRETGLKQKWQIKPGTHIESAFKQ